VTAGEGAAAVRVVRIDEGEPTWVVVLQGEFDVANAAMLREAIEEARAQARIGGADHDRPTVIDAAAVGFMDSSAIGVLLHARADGPIVLRSPSAAVRLVVEATGLTSVLRYEA
jgi:anti-anti-sigma factor